MIVEILLFLQSNKCDDFFERHKVKKLFSFFIPLCHRNYLFISEDYSVSSVYDGTINLNGLHCNKIMLISTNTFAKISKTG